MQFFVNITKNPDNESQGGHLAVTQEVEHYMAERIAVCTSWGYPLDNLDARYFANNVWTNEERREVLQGQYAQLK